MPTPTSELRDKIRHYEQTRTCSILHCGKPVYRLNRYCAEHEGKYRRTGHPLGLAVTGTQFKRWREVITRPWLNWQLQADHPDAKGACADMDRWLRTGMGVARYHTRLSLETRVRYHIGRLFAAGLEGQDIVEGFVAMHALHIYDPSIFPQGLGNRHFKVQTAGRLMGLPASKPATTPGHKPAARESFAVRERLFHQVNYRLGQFARRAAPEVVKTMPDFQPQFDSGAPFAPPPRTS